MSDLIPNCYHLVGSEFLKKSDKNIHLVKASEFDGWLIPFEYENLKKDYESRYDIIEVYDPVINEPKEIQNLLYRKQIQRSKIRKIELDVIDYAISIDRLVSDLEYDEGFISKRKIWMILYNLSIKLTKK